MIKHIYYNNNRSVGYRATHIFLQSYWIYLSNHTVHEYMNQRLNLNDVKMRKKLKYKSCKKHNIFDNMLSQNFNVYEKIRYGAQVLHIYTNQIVNLDITVYDRAVIASVNSNYINTDLVIETPKEHWNKSI